MDPLEEVIASIILGLRREESPTNLLQEIKKIKLEDRFYKEILESVTRQLANSLDERSLFGRLVKLDEEGLERIKESSEEFLEFEPFKRVDRVKALKFWSDVLNIVLTKLKEESGK